MPTASIKAPKLARRKRNKGKLGRIRATLPGKKAGGAPVSLYDRIKHLAGSISGPGDLSTNPKRMEGYGRSRTP